MSTIKFIDTRDRHYQPIDQIKEKYDGYCVCIVKCDTNKTGWVFGGEVLAVGDSVPALLKATRDITDDEALGLVYYPSFKGFGDISMSNVLQVVEHND
jgi:hypothetical protein